MRWLAALGGISMVVALAIWPQAGRAQTPVVVEFFTSQGCASCPPADAFFSRLARQPGVIALALHVDYWDYMGWKDTFGKAAHSERQRRYAKAHGERTIYTPQMIVHGTDLMMGHDEAGILQRIGVHAGTGAGAEIEVRRIGSGLEINLSPGAGGGGASEVHVVEYVPEQTLTVESGENAGYRHTFSNVVTRWLTIGRWDGRSTTTLRHEGAVGAHGAVLVQGAEFGGMVAAAPLP